MKHVEYAVSEWRGNTYMNGAGGVGLSKELYNNDVMLLMIS